VVYDRCASHVRRGQARRVVMKREPGQEAWRPRCSRLERAWRMCATPR